MNQRSSVVIILLVLLAVADCFTGYAQKIRYADKNNKWISSGYNYPSHSSYERKRTYGTDTIMYGRTYQPVLDMTILEPISAPAVITNSVEMYVREDTVSNIVYYRNFTLDTFEHVLYNFGLQLGDTITYFPQGMLTWIGPETDSVISIDSILINGSFHKVVTMWPISTGNTNNSFTYIEGVGSLNGSYPPFHADCAGSLSEWLGCFSQNGAPPAITTGFVACNHDPRIFTNSAYCGILSVPAAATGTNQYTVFPNPANDFVTVSNILGWDTRISITNAVGQELISSFITKNHRQVEINISNLRAGIYFYTIAGNSTIQTGKLVIMH